MDYNTPISLRNLHDETEFIFESYVNIDNSTMDDIMIWCRENCSGSYFVSKFVIGFYNSRDYTAWKLAWGSDFG